MFVTNESIQEQDQLATGFFIRLLMNVKTGKENLSRESNFPIHLTENKFVDGWCGYKKGEYTEYR